MSKYNHLDLRKKAIYVLSIKGFNQQYKSFMTTMVRRTGLSYESIDTRLTALAAGL